MDGLGRVGSTVVAIGAVGFAVGCGAAGLQYLVVEVLLAAVRDLPYAAMSVVPVAGLVVTAAALRWSVPDADPSTTDDLLRSVSGRRMLDPWAVPGRAVGLIATTGSGGALGLDGAIGYLGAAAGASATRWLARLRLDAETMIVAGGAAGLAAVFQQPLFGALFVVEAPYRVGIDVRRLPPALVGGIAGYAGFQLCLDTSPILQVAAVDLNSRLIVAALLAGVVAGVVARGFGLLMVQARELSASLVLPVRLMLTGAALVGLFLASSLSDVDGLTLGPGGATLAWAVEPRQATAVVLAIVVLRMVSTSAMVVGGGVGGLLVPLLVVGGMSGRAIAGPVASNQMVAVAVLAGAAAMAAGYRVPFAGVAFAAVTLGTVTGIVPAVLAVGSAMLVSPGVAVTTAQRAQVRAAPPGPTQPIRAAASDSERGAWRRRPRASVLSEASEWDDLGEEPWDDDAWEDPRA